MEERPIEVASVDAGLLARRLVELEDRIDGETALRAELVDGLVSSREPLRMLQELAGRLADVDGTGDQAVELAEGLSVIARRLDALLDLEAFGRREISGELEAFDPRKLLEGSLAALGVPAGERGIELVGDLDPALPERLQGDAAGLREVVRRLVGGSLRRASGGEVLVHLRRAGDEGDKASLLLQVEDSGFAPNDEEIASLLADSGRSGLARCVDYAEANGGSFRIAAGSNGGTLAELALLFPSAVVPHADAEESGLLAGTRVLLVDDNASAREVGERLLTSFGCRVTTADGVGRAMAEINLASQEADPYRICLVDLRMPGKGGFQLAEQLRDSDTKLVLMYSNCREGDLMEARRRGFSAEIGKPFRVGVLRRTITNLLPQADAQNLEPRALRILLAEDNPLHSRVTSSAIRREEHEVHTARSGKEALEMLERERYDLVLMDRHMPELDGLFATRAARELENGRDIPIIGMTSASSARERRDCLDAGMDELVFKPITAVVLREVIARWCD